MSTAPFSIFSTLTALYWGAKGAAGVPGVVSMGKHHSGHEQKEGSSSGLRDLRQESHTQPTEAELVTLTSELEAGRVQTLVGMWLLSSSQMFLTKTSKSVFLMQNCLNFKTSFFLSPYRDDEMKHLSGWIWLRLKTIEGFGCLTVKE